MAHFNSSQRIPRSCDRCRISKIKCVFKVDKCQACHQIGVECTFANPLSLKHRPATENDLLQLQSKCHSLEILIKHLSPSLDLNHLPNLKKFDLNQSHSQHQSSILKSFLIDPIHHQSNQSHQQSQLQSSYQSQSQNSNHHLNLHSKSHSNQFKSSSHFNPYPNSLPFFQNLFSFFTPTSTSDLHQFNHSNSYQSFKLSLTEKLLSHHYQRSIQAFQHLYPQPDLEKDLLKLYFAHIHPLLPILHPKSFLHLHASGLANLNFSFRLLCLTIFAISSRFSDDQRVFIDPLGHHRPSHHTIGLRYGFLASLYLYQPALTSFNLFHLQAYLLLCIYFYGNTTPMFIWLSIGFALQKAQAAGAHRMHSTKWASNQLHDVLRRIVFFALYELDQSLSVVLERAPSIQEEDFDLIAPSMDLADSLGIFDNPFLKSNLSSNPKLAIMENFGAWLSLKAAVLDLRSLLTVTEKIDARKFLPKHINWQGSMASFLTQVDENLKSCFESFPALTHKFDHQNINLFHLHSSVCVITWYHEVRLLIYRTLIYQTSLYGPVVENSMKTYVTNCAEAAIQLIQQMDKLKIKGLLSHGFFWIPMRTMTAAIALIYLLKSKKDQLEDKLIKKICQTIELGLEILSELAPSVYLANSGLHITKNFYTSFCITKKTSK
ncbi:hypothetical protein O181_068152 [Austropuccinia psidii MF-1]|uniref:Zn(2)-C6 fungal-type domain-containing protein n=1 Tax=Austropuccinia psidii MF-1 TaxID=1389203 RepID=A0A9Q3F203_9BASI|nr:hypothetical protein [Austropuccinia psidii MF-1]